MLLGIEVLVLFLFAIYALVRVYGGTAESYSILLQWDWFNPFTLDFGSVIAPALLTAIFIYWGWDTAVSVNEETADPGKTPGRAAVVSTLLFLVTYALVTVATVAFAGVGTSGVGLGKEDNANDVFSAIGPALFGTSPLGRIALMLLAASILTSASASTQTTILPTARRRGSGTCIPSCSAPGSGTGFLSVARPRFPQPRIVGLVMPIASSSADQCPANHHNQR